MSYQRETNPHFLPTHHEYDPTIDDFSSQTPPPRRSRPPPIRHHQRTTVEPPQAPRPQPPPLPPFQSGTPPQPHHEPPLAHGRPQPPPPPQSRHEPPHRPRQQNNNHPRPIDPRRSDQQHGHAGPHPSSLLHGPKARRTRPVAWLLAAFCALFWILVIVGGLIILIVYLVFRPRNPRFDISDATFNAAYLDLGYLLNADVTLLANFTNPNSKVSVDFTYVVFDLYYEDNFIATRYVEPFSLVRGQSMFYRVHLMTSQVRLSLRHSVDLQRQMESGRVDFEIRGMFKTKSRFGGLFQYSYWLYTHCRIAATGPPTGVLIGKKCVTKR